MFIQCKRTEKNHVKWAENDRLRMWIEVRKKNDECLIRTMLN